MNSPLMGDFIIFAQFEFADSNLDREGGKKEADDLEVAMKSLGFNVRRFNNNKTRGIR